MKTINGIIHNEKFRSNKLNGLNANQKSSGDEFKTTAILALTTFTLVYFSFYFLSEIIA